MATGRQPIPICQAAAESGGRLSGSFFASTVPTAKPMRAAERHDDARQLFHAGGKTIAAHDRRRGPRTPSPAKSPATGWAARRAPARPASRPRSAWCRRSARPRWPAATAAPAPSAPSTAATLSIAASTSRGHSARGTCRLWPEHSASAASRPAPITPVRAAHGQRRQFAQQVFVTGQLNPQPTEVMARNIRPAGVMAARARRRF